MTRIALPAFLSLFASSTVRPQMSSVAKWTSFVRYAALQAAHWQGTKPSCGITSTQGCLNVIMGQRVPSETPRTDGLSPRS